MHTAFISHPDTLLHLMENNHPESPLRISAIRDRLIAAQVFDHLQLYDAPLATIEQLERIHAAEYIQQLRQASPLAGLVHLDQDTAIGPNTLTAALRAAGSVVLATDLVMTGQAPNAFCCVRPPGHHAGRSRSGGFCLFNNVAVGVAHAMAHHNVAHVAIIDFDVHHGDGSEDIFQHNPDVLLCSAFQHPFYPYQGATSGNDHIINVPLPAGTSGRDFRSAVEREFAPALERFKPEILFISAGFDAHRDDLLAEFNLVRDDYIWITEFIKDVARSHAQDRIVSVLEGGYDLISLADSATAHIRTLAGL